MDLEGPPTNYFKVAFFTFGIATSLVILHGLLTGSDPLSPDFLLLFAMTFIGLGVFYYLWRRLERPKKLELRVIVPRVGGFLAQERVDGDWVGIMPKTLKKWHNYKYQREFCVVETREEAEEILTQRRRKYQEAIERDEEESRNEP